MSASDLVQPDGHYTTTTNECLFTVDPVTFAHVRLQLVTSKLFLQGEKPVREEDDTRVYSPISGCPLHGDLPNSDSIGTKKAVNYLVRFYIRTQNEVYRSEKDMGLKAIETTTLKVTEAEKKRVTRATSRSSADLGKSGTKPEIYQEFEKLRSFLSERDQGSIPKSEKAASKAVMVGTLVRLRRIAFARNQGLEKRLEEEAKASSNLATSRESREEELDGRTFFSLNGCRAMNDRRFVRHNFPENF